MKARQKAAQMLAENLAACESNDYTQLTINCIEDIILELKFLKTSEIKERIQYWQQVKDYVISIKS